MVVKVRELFLLAFLFSLLAKETWDTLAWPVGGHVRENQLNL